MIWRCSFIKISHNQRSWVPFINGSFAAVALITLSGKTLLGKSANILVKWRIFFPGDKFSPWTSFPSTNCFTEKVFFQNSKTVWNLKRPLWWEKEKRGYKVTRYIIKYKCLFFKHTRLLITSNGFFSPSSSSGAKKKKKRPQDLFHEDHQHHQLYPDHALWAAHRYDFPLLGPQNGQLPIVGALPNIKTFWFNLSAVIRQPVMLQHLRLCLSYFVVLNTFHTSPAQCVINIRRSFAA